MDLQAEFEQERARRITLEDELAFWLKGAMEKLTPEELAMTVERQQVETLTYHLLKSRQTINDLNAKLSSKDKELTLAAEKITRLEGDFESKKREVEGLSASLKVSESELEKLIGERSGGEGVDALLSPSGVGQNITQTKTQLTPKEKEQPKNVKDFLQLMKRIGRIKLIDAAILLDVKPTVVAKWAEQFSGRGYLLIEGTSDRRVLLATERLIGLR
ncbi:MAG: hypothetical protein V1744_04070 [Candidatus Altiarchaeota archaeon]